MISCEFLSPLFGRRTFLAFNYIGLYLINRWQCKAITIIAHYAFIKLGLWYFGHHFADAITQAFCDIGHFLTSTLNIILGIQLLIGNSAYYNNLSPFQRCFHFVIEHRTQFSLSVSVLTRRSFHLTAIRIDCNQRRETFRRKLFE